MPPDPPGFGPSLTSVPILAVPHYGGRPQSRRLPPVLPEAIEAVKHQNIEIISANIVSM